MSNESPKPTVLVLIGPTAVGKTDLSIELAKLVNGEIISADSRLFYRGMDIGTAKPTQAQMSVVPHHLIDCADPQEIWSLAIYREKVYQCIEEILARGRQPIIVGGTGQYIRAVSEGWELPPQQPDDAMREALQRWADKIGGQELYEKLKLIDGPAAAEIDPTNVRRTIRALEVIFLTGKRFSDQRRKVETKYRFFIIGLTRPREELYQRIDQRVEAMFRQGLLEETKQLVEKGIPADHPNLSAIGYREVRDHLEGRITIADAKAAMKKKTREFVRRQRNWFKPDDPEIHWIEMSGIALDEIVKLLRVAN